MHPQADSLPAGGGRRRFLRSAWASRPGRGLPPGAPPVLDLAFSRRRSGAPPGWRQRQRHEHCAAARHRPACRTAPRTGATTTSRMAPFDQLQDIASRHHAFSQHPVCQPVRPDSSTLRDIQATSKRSLSFQQGMRPWDTSSSAVPARTRSPRQTSASLAGAEVLAEGARLISRGVRPVRRSRRRSVRADNGGSPSRCRHGRAGRLVRHPPGRQGDLTRRRAEIAMPLREPGG